MNLEKLIVRLRIEEDNKKNLVFILDNWKSIEQNLVQGSTRRGSSRVIHQRDNNKSAKKSTSHCYYCEEVRYCTSKCHKPKKNAQANVIVIDTLSEGIQKMNLSKVFLNVTTLENQENGGLILALLATFVLIRICFRTTKNSMENNFS